ncbi:MAG: XdhC family protein [Pseudomonadota bacterium]
MHKQSLNVFFRRYQEAREPLVLGLVIASSGSTYSKPGDCMLIDGHGSYHGMLSGGCLEGDLALRAAKVVDSGQADRVVYDLAGDDELWGLGVGCEGSIEVLLLNLDARNGYEPYASMAAVFESRTPATLAVVLESAHLPAGSSRLVAQSPGDIEVPAPGSGEPGLAGLEGLENAKHGEHIVAADGDTEAICLRLVPIPRLLLLGAGPDVIPLVNLARELGWHTTLLDHRPAFIENPALAAADERLCQPSAAAAERLQDEHFDAAVVMSHHLESDRNYLNYLARSPIAFVGLLGPVSRRDRLLAELGPAAASLEPRLQAPAGLPLGGRGAASIALSISAGIEAYLARRDA